MIRMLVITAFAVKLAHLSPIGFVWMTNIIAGRRHIKSNKSVQDRVLWRAETEKYGGERGGRQVEDVFIPGAGSVSPLGRGEWRREWLRWINIFLVCVLPAFSPSRENLSDWLSMTMS